MDELRQAIAVWCPTFPRRAMLRQRECVNPSSVYSLASGHIDVDNPAFVSVYGFPNGHPKDGHVPAIDTLFIDFDIPSSGEYRSQKPDMDAWRRDMSKLLTRVRAVCKMLVREGRANNFRASLSGHKGVHLYLDFPEIDIGDDTLGQAKAGMGEYSDNLLEYLQSETRMDLTEWIDVDSSDMARLCRLPNVIHPGASRAFNEDRYCVPVSIRELATIRPGEYIELTQEPRPVPESCRRSPSEKAGNVIAQYIQNASVSNYRRSRSGGSTYDPQAIEAYKDEQNDRITIDDLGFLASQKPCITAFREREDMFNYGSESHHMELNVIGFLVSRNVPIDVIQEYFAVVPEYDEEETLKQIHTVIARDYSEWSCEKIWNKADEFCLGDECRIYRNDYDAVELTQ